MLRKAVGLDPDPELIAEGRRAAEERGIANIAWVQSFWWTDEVRVAEAVHDMLEPGGALVLVMHKHDGRAVPPGPGPLPVR